MQAACEIAPQICMPMMRTAEEQSELTALDLSHKSPESMGRCECIACIVARLDVPANARKILLKHWTRKCHFRNSSSPPLNFDHRSSDSLYHHFSSQTSTDLWAAQRAHNKSENGRPCKIRRKSPEPKTETTAFEYPHQETESTRRDQSPCSVSPPSHSQSPLEWLSANSSIFAQKPHQLVSHLPPRMQQLSVETWFTETNKSSPTYMRSSPDRPASSSSPAEDFETKSSSSSSAPRSPTSTSSDHAGVALKDDKDLLYWQRRLRNNLAAKRSRDARRQREDQVAATCQRMEDLKQRLAFIRTEYIKLLQ